MPACIEHVKAKYGDRLDAYSFSQDAHDLAAYIEATRETGKKVFIWGGSGGTYWAQRFLQLYPEAVNGVILEGIAPADFSIAMQAEYTEKVARRILELCKQDPFCSKKLPAPLQTAERVFAALASGHCSKIGLVPKELATAVRTAIGQVSYFRPYNALIPSLLYRLDRCSDGDVAFLQTLAEVAEGLDDEPGRESSEVLSALLMFSELWLSSEMPDRQSVTDYLEDVADGALFAPGIWLDWASIAAEVPTYLEPLDGTWADTNVPMLMLQGELDPATPHSEAVSMKEHFNAETQHFVSFPYAAHNVIFGSPDGSPLFGDCTFSLVMDFIDDPTGPLDVSCATRTLPPDFKGADLARDIFGTSNLFED